MAFPGSADGCPEKARLADLAAEAHRRVTALHNSEVAESLKGKFGSDAVQAQMVEWRELEVHLTHRLEEHVATHEC